MQIRPKSRPKKGSNIPEEGDEFQTSNVNIGLKWQIVPSRDKGVFSGEAECTMIAIHHVIL